LVRKERSLYFNRDDKARPLHVGRGDVLVALWGLRSFAGSGWQICWSVWFVDGCEENARCLSRFDM